MPTLNTQRWIVIATKAPGGGALDRWEYLPGYNARNVNVAVGTGRLLTAHKRVDAGWHLVAKLPQPKAKR
jgi:hypothetical protein